mmetsp:Transcript_19790/g.50370  ORF Transcript_19790/g.50370 Transcript_19790/m.50370 type:complete len:157 (-) Transcript_19790:562-1032(-)
MITVILGADVEGLGEKGSLVEVKPAYAENFLISKGLGEKASTELIEKVEAEQKEAAAAAAAAKKVAMSSKDALSQKFGSKGLVVEVQMSKEGEITTEVTSSLIASAISRGGVQVEASCISIPEITELGSVIAEVDLHPEVSTSVKVVVEKSKIVFV